MINVTVTKMLGTYIAHCRNAGYPTILRQYKSKAAVAAGVHQEFGAVRWDWKC